jgi:uncharacterized membrane protein YoaK (UPF0700 family)
MCVGGQNSSGRRVALSVALALTWIAGLVDAIGFLSFARIYTANMSGNSVSLGIALAEQNWPTALLRFWPVLLYVWGLLLGRVLLEVGARLRISRIATLVFLLESILLGISAWLGDLPQTPPRQVETYTAIALLAFAMGMQNAALTRFSTLTLHSGFVTGTLLKANSELVKALTWIWENARNVGGLVPALRAAIRQDSARLSLFLWITWSSYVVGAAIGTFGVHAVKTRSLIIPIAALILLMLVDLRQPLAVQDESQQNKNT